MVTKYVKFEKDAEYIDVVRMAAKLGVVYTGIKKPEIIKRVNERIEEYEKKSLELPDKKVKNTNHEGEIFRQKAPKWYEAENAFPYKKGDIVEVVAGPILIGRLISVTQPSSKKNAIKGHLIHPKTGELQRTHITFDFDKIMLIERDGEKVDNPEEVLYGTLTLPKEEINILELDDQEIIKKDVAVGE
jgi:hypothetical protein